MRKVTTRNVLSVIGISALVLVAAPALKEATIAGAGAHAKTIKSVHFSYARHWKRGHRASTVSRRLIRAPGHALAYSRGSHPRPPTIGETDQLLDCLFSQPFVNCP